jgi:hypothetical protein
VQLAYSLALHVQLAYSLALHVQLAYSLALHVLLGRARLCAAVPSCLRSPLAAARCLVRREGLAAAPATHQTSSTLHTLLCCLAAAGV